MTTNQKAGFYEVVEKLTRHSIKKIALDKLAILKELEKIDFFELSEPEAEEFWAEKTQIEKEYNAIQGYIMLVESLSEAYINSLDKAVTFDVIKHIELDIAYEQGGLMLSKHTSALKSINQKATQLLNQTRI